MTSRYKIKHLNVRIPKGLSTKIDTLNLNPCTLDFKYLEKITISFTCKDSLSLWNLFYRFLPQLNEVFIEVFLFEYGYNFLRTYIVHRDWSTQAEKGLSILHRPDKINFHCVKRNESYDWKKPLDTFEFCLLMKHE